MEKFWLFERAFDLFVSVIEEIFRYLKKCALYLFILYEGKFLLFEETAVSILFIRRGNFCID